MKSFQIFLNKMAGAGLVIAVLFGGAFAQQKTPDQQTAPQKEITLPVKGMNCEMCAKTIEKELRKLKGVKEARVSYEKEEATVVFNPREVSISAIKRAIGQAGFQAGDVLEPGKTARISEGPSQKGQMMRGAGNSGQKEASSQNMSPEELKKWLKAGKKDFLLVNVHIPYAGEIPGTDLFVPFNKIQENISKFPKDKREKIVVYCRSGPMSTIAAGALVSLGFTNVYNLTGGMKAWTKAGFTLKQRSGK